MFFADPTLLDKAMPFAMEKLRATPDDVQMGAQIFQLANAAPEAMAKYNDVLCLMIKKKVPMHTMAATALGQTAKFNPTPMSAIVDEIW